CRYSANASAVFPFCRSFSAFSTRRAMSARLGFSGMVALAIGSSALILGFVPCTSNAVRALGDYESHAALFVHPSGSSWLPTRIAEILAITPPETGVFHPVCRFQAGGLPCLSKPGGYRDQFRPAPGLAAAPICSSQTALPPGTRLRLTPCGRGFGLPRIRARSRWSGAGPVHSRSG